LQLIVIINIVLNTNQGLINKHTKTALTYNFKGQCFNSITLILGPDIHLD